MGAFNKTSEEMSETLMSTDHSVDDGRISGEPIAFKKSDFDFLFGEDKKSSLFEEQDSPENTEHNKKEKFTTPQVAKIHPETEAFDLFAEAEAISSHGITAATDLEKNRALERAEVDAPKPKEVDEPEPKIEAKKVVPVQSPSVDIEGESFAIQDSPFEETSEKTKTKGVVFEDISPSAYKFTEHKLAALEENVAEANKAFDAKREHIIASIPRLPGSMRLFAKEQVIKNTPDSLFQETKQALAHHRRVRRQHSADMLRIDIFPAVNYYCTEFLAQYEAEGIKNKEAIAKDVDAISAALKEILEILGCENDQLLSKNDLRRLFRNLHIIQSNIDRLSKDLKKYGASIDTDLLEKISRSLRLTRTQLSILYDGYRQGYALIETPNKKTGQLEKTATKDHTPWNQLTTRGKWFRVFKRTLQALKYVAIALAIIGLILVLTSNPAGAAVLGAASIIAGVITVGLQSEKITKWSFNKGKDHVVTTWAQVKQAPMIAFWSIYGLISVACGLPAGSSAAITNPVTWIQRAQVRWGEALGTLHHIVATRITVRAIKRTIDVVSGVVGKLLGLKTATTAVKKAIEDYKTNAPVEVQPPQFELQGKGDGKQLQQVVGETTQTITQALQDKPQQVAAQQQVAQAVQAVSTDTLASVTQAPAPISQEDLFGDATKPKNSSQETPEQKRLLKGLVQDNSQERAILDGLTREPQSSPQEDLATNAVRLGLFNHNSTSATQLPRQEPQAAVQHPLQQQPQ